MTIIFKEEVENVLRRHSSKTVKLIAVITKYQDQARSSMKLIMAFQ